MEPTIKNITSRPLEEIPKVVKSDNQPKKRKHTDKGSREDVLILHGQRKKKISQPKAESSTSLPGHEVDIVVR